MSGGIAAEVLCAACGHRSGPGARFCGACGAQLPLVAAVTCAGCGKVNPSDLRYCEACGSAIAPVAPASADPRSYTPPELAEKILLTRQALEGEHKQVTVLFADVKGSMQLTEMVDSWTWRRIMDRFVAILTDSVHRFEGTVTQFTGDGIMALFGAPIAHEDHAIRAALAALEMREELRGYALELEREHRLRFQVRIGLNSGAVVVGTIGDDLHMEYTAIGHTVGLAARVEELAEPGTIYVTASTAELITGYCRCTDLGATEIRGHQGAVRLFELVEKGEARSSLEAAQARGFSQFVGREDEMTTLEAALVRAVEGRAEAIGIVGEAGVGKSRLCHEFAQLCRERGIAVRETRGIAHGRGIPLLPFLHLCRQVFGVDEQDSEEVARHKITTRLLAFDRNLDDSLPLLCDFLGVPDPDNPAPRTDPDGRQRQLIDIIRRVTHARSRQEPAVILFDDLHWVDAASEALLASLVDALPGTRTLVLVNFRPEYRVPWAHKSYYRQVPLQPLDDEASANLLLDLLGTDASVAALAARIRGRTSGNPFFIEQVTHSLAESGVLDGDKGAYRLTRPVDEVAIPASVQATLAARIDRLGPYDKALLQTASVIGREFAEPVLRHVLDADPGELSGALSRLIDAEHLFVKSLHPEAVYAVKHPLTQEVAYSSQLEERRALVHSAVARTIEALYPDDLDERAAVIAHHWERAGERVRAAGWWRRAAAWVAPNDPDAAQHNWHRVRDLLRDAPRTDETTALDLAACTAILRLGWRLGASAASTRALLDEGKALAARTGQPRDLALLLVAYAGDRLAAGDLRQSLQQAQESMALADTTGDRELRVAVRQNVAALFVLMGRLDEAEAVIDQALALTGDDLGLGESLLGFSPALWFTMTRAAWLDALRGSLVRAAGELRRVIALANARSETEILGWAHGYLATVGWLGDDADVASRHAEHAVRCAETIGSPFSVVHADIALSLAHLLDQSWAKAAGRLENTLFMGRTQGTGLNREALILTYLAQAETGMGDLPAAVAHVEEALEVARRQGSRLFECVAHLARAGIGLAGEEPEAEVVRVALEEAEACIRDTGATVYQRFVNEHRAELARRQ